MLNDTARNWTGNRTRFTLRPVTEDDLLPEDLQPEVKIALIAVFVLIITLALFSNLVVLCVIGFHRQLHTVTNTFIVSLALSDILVAGINMPIQLAYYIQNEWTMGEVLCKLSKYVQGVVIVASILTLTVIAFDRYYAICHPLRARLVHTIKRAIRVIIICWVLALLFVSPQLKVQRLEPFLVRLPTPPGQEPDLANSSSHSLRPKVRYKVVQACAEYFYYHELNVVYSFITYFLLYLFPVGFVLVTYMLIAREISRRQRAAEVVSLPDSSRVFQTASLRPESDRAFAFDRHRDLKDKHLIVRMLFAIVLLFAVSWFPFFTWHIYLLFDDQGHRQMSTRVLMAFLQLFGYSNSWTNSVIYCFLSENFQKCLFRRTICCLAWGGRSDGAPPRSFPSRTRWGGSLTETTDQRSHGLTKDGNNQLEQRGPGLLKLKNMEMLRTTTVL